VGKLLHAFSSSPSALLLLPLAFFQKNAVADAYDMADPTERQTLLQDIDIDLTDYIFKGAAIMLPLLSGTLAQVLQSAFHD